MAEFKFGKITVKTSNADKIFFPKTKITKGDLIEYYSNIADVMLPHLKDRPISMLRFPDGLNGEIFFQKEASDYFPKWIKTKKIKKEKGTVNHVVCNNKATLVYLANQACVTSHTWLSRIDKLKKPDKIIFDLDPLDNDKFSNVKFAASIFKDFCINELGMNVYLMTTGSKGLNVVLPLIRNEEFEAVRKFAQETAKVLANRHSQKLTIEVRKNKRKGRVFLDTARNAYAQTAVSPYSVRPIEGAPVAAPIEWDELNDSKLNSQSYNIKNIFNRLNKIDEPWKDLNKKKNSLKSARKILDEIIKEELA